MRTTVRLDADIASAVEDMRADRRLSLSDAINLLARNGLERVSSSPRAVFVQRTAPCGLTVDVSNVAEALDILDGVRHS